MRFKVAGRPAGRSRLGRVDRDPSLQVFVAPQKWGRLIINFGVATAGRPATLMKKVKHEGGDAI